jgi:hypothetical protein
LITHETTLLKMSHFKARPAARRLVVVLLLIVLDALVSPTQSAQQKSAGLIVTLSEFQVGKRPPELNYNSCINVWTDGRFHLERRLMPMTAPATLLTYDSSLPDVQFQEVKKILESDSVRHLPPLVAADPSAAKTWVRGVEMSITRDGTVQKTGYFEWGTHDPGNAAQPAHDVVNSPQAEVSSAFKPLEEWFHHVTSIRLTKQNAESTQCGAPSEE